MMHCCLLAPSHLSHSIETAHCHTAQSINLLQRTQCFLPPDKQGTQAPKTQGSYSFRKLYRIQYFLSLVFRISAPVTAVKPLQQAKLGPIPTQLGSCKVLCHLWHTLLHNTISQSINQHCCAKCFCTNSHVSAPARYRDRDQSHVSAVNTHNTEMVCQISAGRAPVSEGDACGTGCIPTCLPSFAALRRAR
jgi:hypothetical protein